MERLMSDWRAVKGYEGRYEVSLEGQVRRCWKTRPPTLLTPYRRKARGNSRRSAREFVKLTSFDGRSRDVAIIKIVGEAWIGQPPPGWVYYHKNGDTRDHHANNIGVIALVALGKKTGGKSKRRPVRKIDKSGDVIAFYPSARAAARSNYISYQAVMDRCNGRVKKAFALDGYSYQWDDDVPGR